jgi:hypothetical protein
MMKELQALRRLRLLTTARFFLETDPAFKAELVAALKKYAQAMAEKHRYELAFEAAYPRGGRGAG